MDSLTVELAPEHRTLLDTASALEPNELDHFFGDVLQNMVNGGTRVSRGS